MKYGFSEFNFIACEYGPIGLGADSVYIIFLFIISALINEGKQLQNKPKFLRKSRSDKMTHINGNYFITV